MIVKQLITYKIINVPLFSNQKLPTEVEIIVEMKTFDMVSNNITKFGKWEGVAIII